MFRRQIAPGIEIRMFTLRDAEIVYAVAGRNRARLREWLPWVDKTESVQDVRDFITRVIAQMEANQGPNAGIWHGDELAGCIGCHPIDWANRNCSIGYWLAEAYQGRGLMTQCCNAILAYLFEEMDLHRVEIRCGTGNLRSCAIPRRLGFTREGVVRQAEWVNDRWVDLVVWSMLQHEWMR